MGREFHKRPGNYRTGGDPDILFDTLRFGAVTASTAASTALQTRGVVSLATTSTTAAIVYTLAAPALGDMLLLSVKDMAALPSSAGVFHIVSTGTFDGNLGTLEMTSTGATALLVCLTSAASQWAWVANSSFVDAIAST